jgi:hypothetical protein
MMDETTTVLSKLASVLDMDTEAILAQSLRDFVAEQITLSQQRMSQGYMEHQRFLRKYGMPWEAFLHALEALEERPEEDTTFRTRRCACPAAATGGSGSWRRAAPRIGPADGERW